MRISQNILKLATQILNFESLVEQASNQIEDVKKFLKTSKYDHIDRLEEFSKVIKRIQNKKEELLDTHGHLFNFIHAFKPYKFEQLEVNQKEELERLFKEIGDQLNQIGRFERQMMAWVEENRPQIYNQYNYGDEPEKFSLEDHSQEFFLDALDLDLRSIAKRKFNVSEQGLISAMTQALREIKSSGSATLIIGPTNIKVHINSKKELNKAGITFHRVELTFEVTSNQTDGRQLDQVFRSVIRTFSKPDTLRGLLLDPKNIYFAGNRTLEILGQPQNQNRVSISSIRFIRSNSLTGSKGTHPQMIEAIKWWDSTAKAEVKAANNSKKDLKATRLQTLLLEDEDPHYMLSPLRSRRDYGYPS